MNRNLRNARRHFQFSIPCRALALALAFELAAALGAAEPSVTSLDDLTKLLRATNFSLPAAVPPANPAPAATNFSVLVPPGVNEALLDFSSASFSTDLVHSAAAQAKETALQQRLKELQLRLESARRQRLARLYAEATPNFTAILESDAPEDMKRTALLELALIAQGENNLARAQQILAQYLHRWPQDPGVPDLLLRQGLLYRQMGLNNLALSKFYAVITTTLTLKTDRLDYYQRVVLQAQAEIAETLYLQGKHQDAADTLARLLKLDFSALIKPQIQFKLIRSLSSLARHDEVVGQTEAFLARYPEAAEQAEVRFFLASALKQLGRNGDALRQVMLLLQGQQALAQKHPETLAYWQQRTGNEIANQLYREGDFVRALDIYLGLLLLDPSPAWQFPVLYQIGLVYERLQQPVKAAEAFGQIISREKELPANAAPGLKAVLEMARWRRDFLGWQVKVEAVQRGLRPSALGTNEPGPLAPALVKVTAPRS